jgi:hypothetical protein
MQKKKKRTRNPRKASKIRGGPSRYSKVILHDGAIVTISDRDWYDNVKAGNLLRTGRDEVEERLFASDPLLARLRPGLLMYKEGEDRTLVFKTGVREQTAPVLDALARIVGVRELIAGNAAQMEREFLFAEPTTTRQQKDDRLKAGLPVWTSKGWKYKALCDGVQLGNTKKVVELNV